MTPNTPATDTAALDTRAELRRLRHLLATATRVSLAARTDHSPPFRGSGDIVVHRPGPGRLYIAENGEWAPAGGSTLRVSNVYEWQIDDRNGAIRLAHARHGSDRSMHLADLTRVRADTWRSMTAHTCGSDTYTAMVRVVGNAVHLRWRVCGPRKTQLLRSVYR